MRHSSTREAVTKRREKMVPLVDKGYTPKTISQVMRIPYNHAYSGVKAIERNPEKYRNSTNQDSGELRTASKTPEVQTVKEISERNYVTFVPIGGYEGFVEAIAWLGHTVGSLGAEIGHNNLYSMTCGNGVKPKTAKNIADALGVSPKELFKIKK